MENILSKMLPPSLKISLKIGCTPTLKADNFIAFLTFKTNLHCQMNSLDVNTS